MTSSDQNKDNPSPQDRIEEIKKEEQEDPTAYYSQGDAKDGFNEEAELSKPVAPVEKAQEEMNLLRAVAYLGFGLAALAIVFILFFIRDLDGRIGGVDSAVNSLEEKIAPLKKEVRDSLARVNTDIIGIKSKMNDSDRSRNYTMITCNLFSFGSSLNVLRIWHTMTDYGGFQSNNWAPTIYCFFNVWVYIQVGCDYFVNHIDDCITSCAFRWTFLYLLFCHQLE